MTEEYRSILLREYSDHKRGVLLYGEYVTGNGFIRAMLHNSTIKCGLLLDRHTQYIAYITPFDIMFLKYWYEGCGRIQYLVWRYLNPNCSNQRLLKFILKADSDEWSRDRNNMWDLCHYYLRR